MLVDGKREIYIGMCERHAIRVWRSDQFMLGSRAGSLCESLF